MTGDEEDEWSYSTAPGQYTLDVLRDRFGEPGYLHPPPRASTDSSRIQITSPRFKSPPSGDPELRGLFLGPASTNLSRHRWEIRPGTASATVTTAQPVPFSGSTGSWGPDPSGRRSVPLDSSQQAAQAMGPWPSGFLWGPPPIAVSFDGDPDCLAMYMGHVLNHLDQFTSMFSSHWVMVVAITERGDEAGKAVLDAGEGAPGFPAVYDDLAEVFSERDCDSLPPHRPTDCAIDILPGAKLPKPRICTP